MRNNNLMDSILLEHNQYGSKILIVNYGDVFLDFFEEVIFEDYKKVLEISSKDHQNILNCINSYSIKIILMEIRSQGGTLDRGLKLFRLIKDLCGKIHIIICSIKSAEEIKKHIPDINKDRIYYLPGKDIRSTQSNNQKALVNIIESIVEELSPDTHIHDKWILKTLSKGSGFEAFKLSFNPFWHLIKNEISLFEKSEYSIWYDKLYDEIIKKRLRPIFDTSGFKYISDAMENFTWLERLSYITPFYSKEKRYRDHFLHQVRIAVLGNFLLDVYLDKKTKLIDYINSILQNHEPSCIFTDFKSGNHKSTIKNCRLSWWVTALMHDYTYPLYFIFEPLLFNKKNREKMLKAYIADFLDPFINNHNLTIKKFRKRFEKKLSKFLEAVKVEKTIKRHILKHIESNISHNITGAFNLWQIQKNQKEKNKNLCIELACQSILLHHSFTENESAESKSIRFFRYPLAFLLILLDEIQDWGRPVILVDNQKDPTETKKNIDLDKIEISGISQRMGDSNKWYFNDDKKIIITLDYGRKNNIEPRSIKRIINSKERNLRRLNIGDDKLPDILVRLKFKGWNPYDIKIERRRI